MNKPVIVVTNAAFDVGRRIILQRLLSQLKLEAPLIPVLVAEDTDRKGSLFCWLLAMEMGLGSDATHIVWLPDDAIVCRDFGAFLQAAIDARPDDVFDCHVNFETPPPHCAWYSCFEGFTGLGGVFPRALLAEHIHWRHTQVLPERFPNDAGVNLWAMDTGRPIFKTGYSLVDHDVAVPSLDGNGHQETIMRRPQKFMNDHRTGAMAGLPHALAKTWLAPEDQCGDFKRAALHVGKVYRYNHLALIRTLKPNMSRVQRYLDIERGHGIPATGRPSLFIACPAYRGEVKANWVISLINETHILHQAGGEVEIHFKSDSLINRCRNRLVTEFLLSTCSHMLMWDTDNYPMRPGWVKGLLETGHDVVGGAVVLKDGKGDKFAMRFGQTGDLELEAVNGCLPVDMIGTGFMMVSRKAIIKMIAKMPETLYLAGRWMDNPGRAEWHLFADVVRNHDHLSEDFEFCARWKDIGGKIYVQPDINFVHEGECPFTGSFSETFKPKIVEHEDPIHGAE